MDEAVKSKVKLLDSDKAVIIEDLISTGGSSLNAAEALRSEGIEVTGIVSIFTYELQSADEAFASAGLTYNSLTEFWSTYGSCEGKRCN